MKICGTVGAPATGSVPGGPTEDAVPPGEPRITIAGASVVLSHGGLCTPASDTLGPREPGSGIYVTSDLCPLAPGDRVQLRVETPDGEIVTGTTTVPGATAVSVCLATDSATFEGQVLELDRQRDTIRIAADAIFARALQVEVRWLDDPDEVAVYLFSDTLGVALPGDLFNPFEGDSGKPVFEVGREYTLAVAVTTVEFSKNLKSDLIEMRGETIQESEKSRISTHLDRIRGTTGTIMRAHVVTQNNFPKGTGIASSASGFAALTVAACGALGLNPSERELTILARLGSGSACRSVPDGFVQWEKGESSETSYAHSLFSASHWDLWT